MIGGLRKIGGRSNLWHYLHEAVALRLTARSNDFQPKFIRLHQAVDLERNIVIRNVRRASHENQQAKEIQINDKLLENINK